LVIGQLLDAAAIALSVHL